MNVVACERRLRSSSHHLHVLKSWIIDQFPYRNRERTSATPLLTPPLTTKRKNLRRNLRLSTTRAKRLPRSLTSARTVSTVSMSSKRRRTARTAPTTFSCNCVVACASPPTSQVPSRRNLHKWQRLCGEISVERKQWKCRRRRQVNNRLCIRQQRQQHLLAHSRMWRRNYEIVYERYDMCHRLMRKAMWRVKRTERKSRLSQWIFK